MPDKHDDEGASCPVGLEYEVRELRKALEEKHKQNRVDIHGMRNTLQAHMLHVAMMEAKLMPLVDNGHPGLISKLSDQIAAISKMLTDVQIVQGIDKGRRTVQEWLVDGVKTLIIGGILALVAHFWK